MLGIQLVKKVTLPFSKRVGFQERICLQKPSQLYFNHPLIGTG